jgi:hypothetical protein
MESQEGWWLQDVTIQANASNWAVRAFRCPSGACLGNNVCSPGRYGRVCGLCNVSQGYSMTSRTSGCSRCSESASYAAEVILFLIGVVVMICVLYMCSFRVLVLEQERRFRQRYCGWLSLENFADFLDGFSAGKREQQPLLDTPFDRVVAGHPQQPSTDDKNARNYAYGGATNLPPSLIGLPPGSGPGMDPAVRMRSAVSTASQASATPSHNNNNSNSNSKLHQASHNIPRTASKSMSYSTVHTGLPHVSKHRLRLQLMMDHALAYLKVMISFAQCAGSIPFVYDVQWPNPLDNQMVILKLSQLDLLSLPIFRCIVIKYVGTMDYYQEFALVTALPVACTAYLLIFPEVFGRIFPAKLSVLRDTCYTWIFYLLYLCYPLCSQTVLSSFHCQDLGPAGVALVSDYSVDCNSDKHMNLHRWAIFLIFVYPIGIPVCLLCVLYAYKIPHIVKRKQQRALIHALVMHFITNAQEQVVEAAIAEDPEHRDFFEVLTPQDMSISHLRAMYAHYVGRAGPLADADAEELRAWLWEHALALENAGKIRRRCLMWDDSLTSGEAPSPLSPQDMELDMPMMVPVRVASTHSELRAPLSPQAMVEERLLQHHRHSSSFKRVSGSAPGIVGSHSQRRPSGGAAAGDASAMSRRASSTVLGAVQSAESGGSGSIPHTPLPKISSSDVMDVPMLSMSTRHRGLASSSAARVLPPQRPEAQLQQRELQHHDRQTEHSPRDGDKNNSCSSSSSKPPASVQGDAPHGAYPQLQPPKRSSSLRDSEETVTKRSEEHVAAKHPPVHAAQEATVETDQIVLDIPPENMPSDHAASDGAGHTSAGHQNKAHEQYSGTESHDARMRVVEHRKDGTSEPENACAENESVMTSGSAFGAHDDGNEENGGSVGRDSHHHAEQGAEEKNPGSLVRPSATATGVQHHHDHHDRLAGTGDNRPERVSDADDSRQHDKRGHDAHDTNMEAPAVNPAYKSAPSGQHDTAHRPPPLAGQPSQGSSPGASAASLQVSPLARNKLEPMTGVTDPAKLTHVLSSNKDLRGALEASMDTLQAGNMHTHTDESSSEVASNTSSSHADNAGALSAPPSQPQAQLLRQTLDRVESEGCQASNSVESPEEERLRANARSGSGVEASHVGARSSSSGAVGAREYSDRDTESSQPGAARSASNRDTESSQPGAARSASNRDTDNSQSLPRNWSRHTGSDISLDRHRDSNHPESIRHRPGSSGGNAHSYHRDVEAQPHDRDRHRRDAPLTQDTKMSAFERLGSHGGSFLRTPSVHGILSRLTSSTTSKSRRVSIHALVVWVMRALVSLCEVRV